MDVFVAAIGLGLAGYFLLRHLLPHLRPQKDADAEASDSTREPDVYQGFFDPVPGLRRSDENEDDTAERSPPQAPGPLITVYTYPETETAHLARVTLEQEGIPAFIADDGVVGMDWLYSNAVGGVKVQVPETFAQSAFEILSESDAAATEEPADTANTQATGVCESPADADADPPTCPACGSTEVYRVPWRRGLFFILYLVLGLALPVATRRHQCDHCRATYRHWPPQNE